LSSTPFAAATDPRFTAVAVGDCTCRFLPTGTQAFAALLRTIDDARQSLCLEMYIFKADAAGERVRAALLAALRRNVQVRILLDAFGSADLPLGFWQEIVDQGAELRWFNPSRVLRVAFRDHRKLCIADNLQAIIGGFNVADEYTGDGVQGGWRDLGMHLSGPVVGQLKATFDRMFIAARMDTRALFDYVRTLTYSRPPLSAPAVLSCGPGFDGTSLRKTLWHDLRVARRVEIVAAYFAPPRRLRRALRVAAERGTVRLLLPGKSDVPLTRLAAQYLYGRMLAQGVRIFEYQPQILHAKLVVIDDIVYVGSSNFDTRSLQLNFDFLVRIPNAALAEQARVLFAGDLIHSSAVTSEGWSASDSFWKRLLRYMAYWLVVRLDPFLARRKWRALR
jgi:cardiolipin synthase A/B